jgi:DNA-binding CsgD family transcriptional regulator
VSLTLSSQDIDPSTVRPRFRLTPREMSVAELLAVGKRNDEIARTLGISGSTARRHTEHVLAKMDVPTRAAVGARLRGEISGSTRQ